MEIMVYLITSNNMEEEDGSTLNRLRKNLSTLLATICVWRFAIHLQGIEDGKEPGKDCGIMIECEYTK